MFAFWTKIRTPVAMVIIAMASLFVGKNLGRREGIAEQIGGPGHHDTAFVEWADQNRKAILHLNDGRRGYVFWIRLDPQYLHYTHLTKVFTCDQGNLKDIEGTLNVVRDWAVHEHEGKERICEACKTQPEPKPEGQ